MTQQQEIDITHLELAHDDTHNHLKVVQDGHKTHPISIAIYQDGYEQYQCYSLSRDELWELTRKLFELCQSIG